MTDQTTTPPTCLGCGGPDCIQRTTPPPDLSRFAAHDIELCNRDRKRWQGIETALDRVRQLHQEYRSPLTDEYDTCAHCNRISGELVPYPCDTIRALGEQA